MTLTATYPTLDKQPARIIIHLWRACRRIARMGVVVFFQCSRRTRAMRLFRAGAQKKSSSYTHASRVACRQKRCEPKYHLYMSASSAGRRVIERNPPIEIFYFRTSRCVESRRRRSIRMRSSRVARSSEAHVDETVRESFVRRSTQSSDHSHI